VVSGTREWSVSCPCQACLGICTSRVLAFDGHLPDWVIVKREQASMPRCDENECSNSHDEIRNSTIGWRLWSRVSLYHEAASHALTWTIGSTACMTCVDHLFTESTRLCHILTGTKAKRWKVSRGPWPVEGYGQTTASRTVYDKIIKMEEIIDVAQL
jgi:hypothetical protein